MLQWECLPYIQGIAGPPGRCIRNYLARDRWKKCFRKILLREHWNELAVRGQHVGGISKFTTQLGIKQYFKV